MAAKLNLGWLADLIAQKLFKLGEAQPQRRAWNVDGITINDDPDNQWLDIEPDPEWIAGETTTTPTAVRDATSDLGNAANGLARADHEHRFGDDPTDAIPDAVDLRYDASAATVDTTGLRVAITALGSATDYAIVVNDGVTDTLRITYDSALTGPNGIAIGAAPANWHASINTLFIADGTAPTTDTGNGSFLWTGAGVLRTMSSGDGTATVSSDVSIRNSVDADIRRAVDTDIVAGGNTGNGNPIDETVSAGKVIEIHYRMVVLDSTGDDAGLIIGNIVAHETAGSVTLDADAIEHTLLPAGDIASDTTSVALVGSEITVNLVNNGVNSHTAKVYYTVTEYDFT